MKKLLTLIAAWILSGQPALAQTLAPGSRTAGGAVNVAAVCDGLILYGGVQTASGSPVISSPSHAFTAADVGAHVAITDPAPTNGSSASPYSAFTGTIVSVSGGGATLSGKVGFTSGGYQYAAGLVCTTADPDGTQSTSPLVAWDVGDGSGDGSGTGSGTPGLGYQIGRASCRERV